MTTIRTLFIALLLFTCAPIATAMEPVNINTADALTLAQGISGVGSKRAEAVVAYRQAHGPFRRIEELANVKGIGPKTIENNRDLLTVGDEAVAPAN